MLPSVEGMEGKLGEGMRAIDFQPNDVWPIDFWPTDVVSILYKRNEMGWVCMA